MQRPELSGHLLRGTGTGSERDGAGQNPKTGRTLSDSARAIIGSILIASDAKFLAEEEQLSRKLSAVGIVGESLRQINRQSALRMLMPDEFFSGRADEIDLTSSFDVFEVTNKVFA